MGKRKLIVYLEKRKLWHRNEEKMNIERLSRERMGGTGEEQRERRGAVWCGVVF